MYSKVIVPLDGSEFSEMALPYARLVAGSLSIPIELVEAYDVLPAALHDHQAVFATKRMLEEAQRRSQEYLSRIRDELNSMGHAASTMTLAGFPPQTVGDWAGGDSATLVVMSTHGRGGITRWAFGSIADKLLHSVPNPVLLVRSGGAERPATEEFKTVLVPLDGSELSESSLPHAASMATALGARVSLLRVTATADYYDFHLSQSLGETGVAANPQHISAEQLVEADAEQARQLLGQAAQSMASEFGFANEVQVCHMQSQNVAQAIEDKAASEHTLVVTTSHGRSGINRLVLGSVTDRVVRHSSVPVLVVRQ